MKRYFNPLRVAAVLLVLYCIGHTWGALLNKPHFGPASDAVLSAMTSVHFRAEGSDCTWFGFYLGFGSVDSVFFLFSALVAWVLGGMQAREQRPWAIVVWALFAAQLATTVFVYRYFFIAPMVFSTAITALLGFGCLRLARAVPSNDARVSPTAK